MASWMDLSEIPADAYPSAVSIMEISEVWVLMHRRQMDASMYYLQKEGKKG